MGIERHLISIIIPVYNEEKTIENVLKRCSALPFDKEILVIDNNSTDRSIELAEKFAYEHGNLKIAIIGRPSRARVMPYKRG